jgi:predicted CopG family antitoxin
MQRKMTISVDEAVYQGLLAVIGKRKMSKYISDLVRPYVLEEAMEAGYQAMAADKEREAEAKEWINAYMGEDMPSEER